MKSAKIIIKGILWPVLFWIGQFVMTFIMASTFKISKYNSFLNANPHLEKKQINAMVDAFISSKEFVSQFSDYLFDHLYIIILINICVFLPIFFLVYKKVSSKEKTVIPKLYIYSIIISIALALTLNILSYTITGHVGNANTTILSFISICIIGPILEEIIYRGIFYNTLKAHFSKYFSMIFVTVIFAITHGSIIQISYALLMGFLFIYLYDKTENLKVPILAHIAANATIELFFMSIISMSTFIKVGLLFICLIPLFHFIYRKLKNNSIF